MFDRFQVYLGIRPSKSTSNHQDEHHYDAVAKKIHNSHTHVDSQALCGVECKWLPLERRLTSAVRTKRLDLSLPRQAQALPEPPVRNQSLHIQPFQIFPVMIIEHVNRGHHLTDFGFKPPLCLPAELSVFTKLRVLGLAGNALTTLPEGLNQLTDLELCLEKNRLRTVPVKGHSHPSCVNYSQPTKTVPEQIHLLRNLVELDLDYNRIMVTYPMGFSSKTGKNWA
ncbi:Leucine-rich repeat domain, L domain-like [Phytophthora cactorum]|nr:Leucine-rich repeat domain, L domain-like [Phytophthora cactorum]